MRQCDPTRNSSSTPPSTTSRSSTSSVEAAGDDRTNPKEKRQRVILLIIAVGAVLCLSFSIKFQKDFSSNAASVFSSTTRKTKSTTSNTTTRTTTIVLQEEETPANRSSRTTPSSRRDILFPYHIIFNNNSNANEKSRQPQLQLQPPEICFVKSSYAASVETSDRVNHPMFNVTKFQQQKPFFRFYIFTNLDKELQEIASVGWTKIVTPNLPYKRFITHSRYGKFMAWLVPEIQECGVVFYMDSNVRLHIGKQTATALVRQLARRILQSPSGLMQMRHPSGGQEQQQQPPSPSGSDSRGNDNNDQSSSSSTTTTTYGPIEEFQLIQRIKKDIPQNVQASLQWLKEQPDFDNEHTPMYTNTYFGYNPKNIHYQALSLAFWDRYSLELDSWRDQPLWSYMMKKLNMTPEVLPRNITSTTTTSSSSGKGSGSGGGSSNDDRIIIFESVRKMRGHGGHQYSAESNTDAVRLS